MKKITLTLLILFLFLIVSTGCTRLIKGGTIISLQKTDFISNDPEIDGEAWLLTIVQNTASQYAEGYFTSSQIKDDEKEARHNLKVTIENSPQECQYDILQQNLFLKNVEKIQIGSVILKGSMEQKCNDECFNNEGVFCGSPDLISPWKVYCFQATKTATYGTVALDKLAFESEIVTEIDGISYSGTISNEYQNSVWLSDGRVQASWTGNLVSGEDCPRAPEQDIVALRHNNVWKYIDENRWDTYKNYDNNGFGNCILSSEDFGDGTGAWTSNTCVNTYNSHSSQALITKSFQATGGEKATSNILSDGNGRGIIELSKDIQFPVITMRIKADILGIVVQVGDPDIIQIESSCFGTGDEGDIVVDIRNKGEVDATFVSSVECQSPFSQSGTSIRTPIDSLDTTTIYIPITGETAQQQEVKSCIVTVHDLENPNNRDSESVEVCVRGINICTPNDERCVGEKLQKCNPAGTSWVTVDEHHSTCISDECTNDLDCPKREGYNVQCKSESLFGGKKKCVYTTTDECEPLWKIGTVTIIPKLSKDCVSWWTPFVLIVTILGGLTVFYFVYEFASKKTPKKKALNIIIAILFGLGTSAIVYFYWWVFLIVLILIIILKIWLK